jgi:hypothetical protein
MERDKAENNSFSQLHLTLVGHVWDSVITCFKKINMQSCLAKKFTKTALALSIKLLVELKQKKNCFTGEVELCQTGPKSNSK